MDVEIVRFERAVGGWWRGYARVNGEVKNFMFNPPFDESTLTEEEREIFKALAVKALLNK